MARRALPLVIQGGMGIAVSNWVLARAVSLRGQLGVVSGTALDNVLVRRLQDGDIGGHVRRAIEHFPIPRVGDEVLRRYFRPEGRPADTPYRAVPLYRKAVSRARQELTMLGSFVEVFLAREDHDGMVGINLLTKVQMPNLPTLYGALLAGAGVVLMGAGIPREIPGALDHLAVHEPAALRLDVEADRGGTAEFLEFDPADYWDGAVPPDVFRPQFFPIIASNSLATMLVRKANGRVDGFVIEGPTAGGHNAPPRGETHFNDRGEPIYGQRDVVDLSRIAELGLPFWLAGGTGSPEGLRHALETGATGIQVGTLFAFSRESGIDPHLRAMVLERARREGGVDVVTDPLASPTGFPFKVVQLENSNAFRAQYEQRQRICDLGYLRVPYRRPDGRIDYRCAAEPVDQFIAKGGDMAQTVGRKCLCNALMANIGLPQVHDGEVERPILTSGDDLQRIGTFLEGRTDYGANDVLHYLLAGVALAEAVGD